MRPTLPHLVVSAVVVDSAARHVLLVRDDPRSRWLLVTGHVEGGETLAESARRHVHERTGLTRVEVVEPHLAVQQDVLVCEDVEARHVDHVFAVVVDPAVPVDVGPLRDSAGVAPDVLDDINPAGEPGDALVAWFAASALPSPLTPGVALHLAGTARLLADR